MGEHAAHWWIDDALAERMGARGPQQAGNLVEDRAAAVCTAAELTG